MPTSTPHHAQKYRTWTRPTFLISTDPSLIPLPALNAAFASPMLYWAQPLPEDMLREMLEGSLNFGVYKLRGDDDDDDDDDEANDKPRTATNNDSRTNTNTNTSSDDPPSNPTNNIPSQRELIGYARLITDHVTFTYLTDVYLLPEWQGQGLGKWLIECVQEVVEGMRWLRRSMALIGSSGGSKSKVEGVGKGAGEGEGDGDGDAGEGGGGMANFYSKLMKMTPLDASAGGPRVIQWKGPGNVY